MSNDESSASVELGAATAPSGSLVLVEAGDAERPVKGLHEKGVWTSTKFRGKERRRVESWRCVGCGFLKSYARDVSS